MKSHLVSLCATVLSCTVAAADQSATALQLSVHNGQYSHWRWFLYHSAVPPDHYHRYSNAAVEKLPLPTQDSRDIIAAACRALNHVWREGYRYMKAGVMLADFTPSGIAQPGLFDEIQPRKNSEKLMKTLDELNQSGKGKVWFAGRGTAPEWQMKREMLSQCYTTKWRDIPLARLG
ncbi:DUF4113 domain-containing protein [Escherichia coli]|nr:DUF4113 domain-containing protein [Escherichia coli]